MAMSDPVCAFDYTSPDNVMSYLLSMEVTMIKLSRKNVTLEEEADIVDVCISRLMRSRATHELKHIMTDGPFCPFCAARILGEALKPRPA
jgi:hypothetical protein